MAGSLRSVLLERDMARRLQEYHTPPPMEASSSSSDIPALSDPCLVVGTEYLSKAGDKGRQQQIACATAALLAASARVPPPLPPEEPSQALWGGRTAEEWARSGHARQAYDWPVVSEFKGKAQWRAGRLYNIGTVVAGEEDDNCCDLSYEVVVSGAGRESFSGSPVNDAGLLQAAAEEEQVQALQEQEQELNSEQAACDDLYGITEEGDDEDEDCRDDAQFSTAALALLPRRGGGQGQSWGQASTRPAQGQYMLTEWHHSHSPAGGQAQGAAQQPRAGQRRVWSASPSSGMRASSGSSSSGGSSSGMVGTRVARQAQLLSVYHHRPTSAPTPTTGATGTTASGAMVASCGAHLAWVGAYPGADKLCRVRPSVAAARPYSCGGSRGSEVAWGVNGRPGSGFRNMVGSLDALSDDLKRLGSTDDDLCCGEGG
ncbi:hypothetical protein FOA52_013443 [Chlamydomonas sp. UWO 241]|nr:hypothetical protein FOA52_013443 [Chlamydomonas sp. UWO 241]